jgi:hypothetical protein
VAQALAAAERETPEAEKEAKRRRGEPLLAPPPRSAAMLNQSPSDYLLNVVKSIRSAELEEVLRL